jgi:hypothetical protein
MKLLLMAGQAKEVLQEFNDAIYINSLILELLKEMLILFCGSQS